MHVSQANIFLLAKRQLHAAWMTHSMKNVFTNWKVVESWTTRRNHVEIILADDCNSFVTHLKSPELCCRITGQQSLVTTTITTTLLTVTTTLLLVTSTTTTLATFTMVVVVVVAFSLPSLTPKTALLTPIPALLASISFTHKQALSPYGV
jgi:fucose 4-O-acetylase-like acetyltransferase